MTHRDNQFSKATRKILPYLIIGFLILGFLIVSCKDSGEEICPECEKDIANPALYDITLLVHDSTGNNLLDQNSKIAYQPQDIIVTKDGIKHEARISGIKANANSPLWDDPSYTIYKDSIAEPTSYYYWYYGGVLYKMENEQWGFSLGAFIAKPTADSVYVSWPDGSSDSIGIRFDISPHINPVKHVYLNGKEMHDTIRLIKRHYPIFN